MSTYEPGTVAMVTFEGERCIALHDAEGNWNLANGAVTCVHEPPEDITPLNIVDATREVSIAITDPHGRMAALISRIAKSIPIGGAR